MSADNPILPPPADEVAQLRELLAQHQEIDRTQGEHIRLLEHDLILARTELRAAANQIQGLQTRLRALSKNLPEA